MAITLVQPAATSATTSIQLTGVQAGNTLVLIVGWYRDPSTLGVYPTPTDSSGNTVNVAVSPVPAKYTGSATHDVGSSVFYVTNASAGTHTFTLSSISALNSTLAEFTPLTSSSFDVSASALTNGPSAATSQGTGTTGSTIQASELVIIGCTLASDGGGGATDVNWTDPVSGFTTLQKVVNTQTNLPILHAWKTISSLGAQSATFNFTANGTNGFMQAAIATFKSGLDHPLTIDAGSLALSGTAVTLRPGSTTYLRYRK